MNKRPRIPIKLRQADYFYEIIAAIGVVCLIILPIYFYNDLPDEIPKHFNALGQVDSFGRRELIWILPMVGLIFYIGLTVLNKYPFVFNYPKKVTVDNAERLYIIGTRTIRLLKVIIIFSFAFLNFKTIEIALNRAEDIGRFYLPILMIILAMLIVTMIYKMIKS